jgi:UDP-N-acetylmuramyl pentapeptide phosphotransferase/UDP-N-acetylglucosamine-1-phosphate transferase
MHNFIFYVMYNYQITKGSTPKFARYNGSLILSISIVLQYLALISIVKHFFNISEYVHFLVSKITLILISAIIFFYFYKFYDEEKISDNTANPTYIDSVTNKLLVFLNIVISIAISIFLAKK